MAGLPRSVGSCTLDSMTVHDDVVVRWLDQASSRDASLVAQLTALINVVYAVAEAGLWRDGAARTTTDEVADLIAARQIAVATTRTADELVGSVRLRQVSDDTTELGMLVAAPERRKIGIGRALVDFAEQHSRDRHMRAIQLELLVPRDWKHPNKEFLKAWYGRRGYRRISTRSLNDTHPQLASLLATPCALDLYEKLESESLAATRKTRQKLDQILRGSTDS